MGVSTTLITNELYEKAVKTLSKMRETNRTAIRLRAIVSAKEHGVNLVAKVFNITSNTLRNWVKDLQANKDLVQEYGGGRGRKSKFSSAHSDAILQWVPRIVISRSIKFYFD